MKQKIKFNPFVKGFILPLLVRTQKGMEIFQMTHPSAASAAEGEMKPQEARVTCSSDQRVLKPAWPLGDLQISLWCGKDPGGRRGRLEETEIRKIT